VKVVRVGMIFACGNITYYHAIKTTLDGLYLAKILNLKTDVGEHCCYLLGCKVGVDILL
jgi:hypothetical protein